MSPSMCDLSVTQFFCANGMTLQFHNTHKKSKKTNKPGLQAVKVELMSINMKKPDKVTVSHICHEILQTTVCVYFYKSVAQACV